MFRNGYFIKKHCIKRINYLFIERKEEEYLWGLIKDSTGCSKVVVDR